MEPKLESDERSLVCEGSCNPDLSDYDYTVQRTMHATAMTGLPPLKSSIALVSDWAGRLKHTSHITADRSYRWSNDHGWVREWVCETCGSKKLF